MLLCEVVAQLYILEVDIVALLQPVVGDDLVLDALGRSVLENIVSREIGEIGIGHRGTIVDLVSESTVELHGEVPVLISEVEVPSEISLRDGLSADLSVTGVTGVDSAVVVKVSDDVLSVLVDSLAVRQIEHADRLPLHEVGDTIVLCKSGGIDACHHNMF